MSQVLIDSANMAAIGDAIRAKNGSADTYLPADMADAIEAIPTGGITPAGTINITQNGTVDVTQYASAAVNVQPNLQAKTATQNGTVTPDTGYDGLSSVVVDVSGGGGSDPELPAEYQEVEYLIFDAHEWMTVSNTPADFIYIGKAKHTGTSNQTRLIGYRQTSGTNALDFDLQLSGRTVSAYIRNNARKMGYLADIDADSVCTVWAVFIGLRTTFFIAKYYNETDSGAGLPFAGLYYGFELYNPITLTKTMKFVPCYRKSDGEIGFYEVYNGVFYPNEGTGTLDKGADVT